MASSFEDPPSSIGKPDPAELGRLEAAVGRLLPSLDRFLEFPESDRSIEDRPAWVAALRQPLPLDGAGLETVVDELQHWVIPYGMRSPHPGFSGHVIGRATTAPLAAGIAAQVAGHFRYYLTSFNFLEQLSLDWLGEMCGIRPGSSAVYTSGGSTANLLAMGAARQAAFESIGVDPAADGIPAGMRVRIYGGTEVHHTIHRAAGVLGLGRRAYSAVDSDSTGRVDPLALDRTLRADRAAGVRPVAIVAVGGATSTGAIDRIGEIADVAAEHGVWLHVDGAYGLPAACLPELGAAFSGVERADSAIVDPHKWLGTPAGCGVVFVRDAALLERAFTQEPAPYLEALSSAETRSQFDDQGTRWFDRSVELSSPARGVWVWAAIREIGLEGVRARIRRHIGFAKHLGARAEADERLELLLPPMLSICCFRYVPEGAGDVASDEIDEINTQIVQLLRAETSLVTSTTRVQGKLAIRPCFVNAGTTLVQVDGLANAVVEIGNRITRQARDGNTGRLSTRSAASSVTRSGLADGEVE
jgi:aromatic-L-amino-acid decarboxylase